MRASAVRLLLISTILIAIPLRGQTVLVDSVTMRDDVVLDATITIPAGTIPSGGFPGVILVHGYGGSKRDMEILASILATYGYASLAYSVRGQGSSGGYSTTSGETERLDLNEVIQHFRTHQGINPDRMGVAGGSQGGIHAWMAAVFRMAGVRAVVPTYATPHFASDLIPGNCVSQALARELSLGSVRYAPDRDVVKDLIIRDDYEDLQAYIASHDLERLLDSVQIPVFQGLGWKDALFPVNAGIRAAASLSARGIPIWSYYGTGGHSEPLNINELTFMITRSIEWLDHWLMDLPLDQAGVPLVFYADDRPEWPHHVTPVWPPEPASMVRLYVESDGLSPAPPASPDSFSFVLEYDSTYSALQAWNDRYDGGGFRNAFQTTTVRLLSPPLLDTADVTGIPRAHLVTASDAGRFQAHARAFDVFDADTGQVWQLMTRGTNGIRNNAPHTDVTTDIECNALSHRVPPGHRIGLEVTSLDLEESGSAHIIPYFLTTHSRLATSPLNPSYVDLPLVGVATFTGMREPVALRPENFHLYQNYPNPFNPTTTIRYGLPRSSAVRLSVYDILGREVTVLVDERKGAGSYEVKFDASGLASGVYFYRIQAGDFAEAKSLVVLK